MRDLRDAGRLVDQGEADAYARWYADRLDPGRHLERYRRRAAISFELGEVDHHIPSEHARAFADGLQHADPAQRSRIRVQLYPGLDHFAVTSSHSALTAAADWLLTTDRSAES